jgi:hypothetical protein
MLKNTIQLRYQQGRTFDHTGVNDSAFHRALFNDSNVTSFGMLEGLMFSSELGSNVINKPLLYLTEAQGNVYTLNPGTTEYAWVLRTEGTVEMRITRVDPNMGTTPGKGGAEFYIYGDIQSFHEPVLLRTEGNNQPLLRIVGHPVQISASEYRYTVKVQDGNHASYVNPKFLQVNSRLFDGGTSVVDELNIDYGSDYYTAMSKLGGMTGNVARKVEFTDKFLRMELSNKLSTETPKMSGENAGTFSGNCFTAGYNYSVSIPGHTEGTPLVQSMFVPTIEARLGERIAYDKEMLMTFGRQEVFAGSNGRTGTVGAGLHQLLREGNYRPHSGNLTLQDIFDDIEAAFSGRQSVSETKIVLKTGSGGIGWMNRMIASHFEGNPYTTGSNVGNLFMRADNSTTVPYGIQVGGQFTSIVMDNGWVITMVYDPNKDNKALYPELMEGENRTVESYCFDVIDLADTDAAPKGANNRSNMAMVYDPTAKYYFSEGNAWDLYKGPIQNGEQIASSNKTCSIKREESCGFTIWDVSRTMRFEMIQN